MKKVLVFAVILAVGGFLNLPGPQGGTTPSVVAIGYKSPIPTSTRTRTATITLTPTRTATSTITLTPTATATATLTLTSTPTVDVAANATQTTKNKNWAGGVATWAPLVGGGTPGPLPSPVP